MLRRPTKVIGARKNCGKQMVKKLPKATAEGATVSNPHSAKWRRVQKGIQKRKKEKRKRDKARNLKLRKKDLESLKSSVKVQSRSGTKKPRKLGIDDGIVAPPVVTVSDRRDTKIPDWLKTRGVSWWGDYCQAVTKAGKQCRNLAVDGCKYCVVHLKKPTKK